ncbi:serine hydrolase domain-containing protein [Xanthomarina gelatinilytica]|uniref:serine hydrolase domain-containing protein n=1 Tax=Xanthomarina gelatinilytica TaxID=1137281 RepID=UPI003AA91D38
MKTKSLKITAVIFLITISLMSFKNKSWNAEKNVNKPIDIIEQINLLIEDFESKGYEGGIYVSSYGKGRSLFSEDYFSANGNVDEKTIFGIASVNKTLTSVAIFKLIEEGKLNLKTTLNSIFNDVPSDKKNITIEQLLTHTSGIADDFIMEGEVDAEKARKLLFKEKLLFKPSDGFQYSSDTFNLLAMVIEKVSGKSYEEFVRKNVLKPLKMKSTFFWSEIVNKKNKGFKIASFENPIPDEWNKRNWGFIGSGGIFLTLEDLSKVANLFDSNSNVLTKTSIEEMVTPIMDFNSRSMGKIGIAKGCFRGNNQEGLAEYISSGSEDYGHNAIVRYFPEKNLKIAVLANTLKTKEGGTVSKEITKDIYKLFKQGQWIKHSN